MAYLGRPASPDVSVTGSTDTFIGNGGTTFTLSRPVKDSNASLLEVFVSNVQQQPSVTYSVASSTLTFVTAPGVGEPIYVTYRDYNVAPFFTVPDGAITGVKLANDAATESKIGTGAVTETKIADSAVTPNKISGQVPVTKGGTGVASLTTNAVLLGNGTSSVVTVSAGDSGNVLTSDGSSWISKATGGSYSLEVFTSPGTWDASAKISAGLKAVKVTVIGGGGGGGGVNAPVSPIGYGSGGGGGGGSIKYIAAPSIPGPVTVTVGTGGPSANVGNTSSFGVFLSATGGAGGINSNTSPSALLIAEVSGGVGSGGDLNFFGGYNKLARFTPGSDQRTTGGDAALMFGVGGIGQGRAGPGAGPYMGGPGIGYGGGGSGSANTAVQLGGSGANGIVVVEEFY